MLWILFSQYVYEVGGLSRQIDQLRLVLIFIYFSPLFLTFRIGYSSKQRLCDARERLFMNFSLSTDALLNKGIRTYVVH